MANRCNRDGILFHRTEPMLNHYHEENDTQDTVDWSTNRCSSNWSHTDSDNLRLSYEEFEYFSLVKECERMLMLNRNKNENQTERINMRLDMRMNMRMRMYMRIKPEKKTLILFLEI